jgi:hypothetical protein
MTLPLRCGVSASEVVPEDAVPRATTARHTLVDVVRDYGFVHYGVLPACGLATDLVAEFAARRPDAEIFPLLFDAPVADAAALGPVWTRTLVLVDRPHYATWVDHLRSVTLVDRVRGGAGMAHVTELDLPDPVARSRPELGPPALVKVAYVGLESGRRDWFWSVATPGALPRLTCGPPTERGKALAAALLIEGRDNPLSVLETPVEESLARIRGLAPTVGNW